MLRKSLLWVQFKRPCFKQGFVSALAKNMFIIVEISIIRGGFREGCWESVSSFAGDFLWSKLGAKNDAKWTFDYKGGIEKTFCCFNSTARDFSKVNMMLKKGCLFLEKNFSPEYVDWLLKVPFLKDGENVGETVDFYSNGWWIANVLEKRVFMPEVFGSIPCYS